MISTSQQFDQAKASPQRIIDCSDIDTILFQQLSNTCMPVPMDLDLDAYPLVPRVDDSNPIPGAWKDTVVRLIPLRPQLYADCPRQEIYHTRPSAMEAHVWMRFLNVLLIACHCLILFQLLVRHRCSSPLPKSNLATSSSSSRHS